MAWAMVGAAAVTVVGGAINSRNSRKAAQGAADTQAESGAAAIAEQRRAAAEAQGYYAPYAGVAERGVEASQFLGDSQTQFDWLQDNPFFQMGLDNANRQTQASSAARGRLSAGDTLMQLNNNALLTAQPLLNGQRQDIGNLMQFGYGVSSGQANAALGVGNNVSGLLTDVGNVQAAGQIGAANAQNQFVSDATGAIAPIFGNSINRWGATNDVNDMLNDPGLF